MSSAFEASIAASLAWASVDAEDAARALRWTRLVWSAGFDQVPPCLVHDLGYTLWRGPAVRFASARRPDAERTLRLRVEDRLLAPWLLDAGIRTAHVVLAGLAPDAVDRTIAHAVGLAVGRRCEGFPVGDPGRLRALVERWNVGVDRDELVRRAGASIFEAERAVVEQVVERFGGRPPFGEEDLWELSHLREVPSEAGRLALRTMHETVRRIGSPSPATILALRRRARDVPVDDASADVYPTGGFDAMSTRGSLENIVRSEVSYVGEAVVDRLDMFDLRYLEGELLYYTRDESPLHEERRRLSIVVELAELRHKVRELSTQTVVLCLGCALRLHADLVEGLGPLAVSTTLALVGRETAILEEEAASVRLSLAADIAHRRARVWTGDALDVLPEPRRIVFAVRPRPPSTLARAWIRVGQRRFVVEETVIAGRRVVSTSSSEVDAADPAALRGMLDRLLLTT